LSEEREERREERGIINDLQKRERKGEKKRKMASVTQTKKKNMVDFFSLSLIFCINQSISFQN